MSDLEVTKWVDELLSTTLTADEAKKCMEHFKFLTPKEKATAFLYLLGKVHRIS